MGACTFIVGAKGKTAKEAFDAEAERDRHENGHLYSGGIGMKSSFRMFPVPAGADVRTAVEAALEDDRHWVSDKWGPAGCVALGAGEWLFFGWASE